MLTNEQIDEIVKMLNIHLTRIDDRMTRLAISSSLRGYLTLFRDNIYDRRYANDL